MTQRTRTRRRVVDIAPLLEQRARERAQAELVDKIGDALAARIAAAVAGLNRDTAVAVYDKLTTHCAFKAMGLDRA